MFVKDGLNQFKLLLSKTTPKDPGRHRRCYIVNEISSTVHSDNAMNSNVNANAVHSDSVR